MSQNSCVFHYKINFFLILMYFLSDPILQGLIASLYLIQPLGIKSFTLSSTLSSKFFCLDFLFQVLFYFSSGILLIKFHFISWNIFIVSLNWLLCIFTDFIPAFIHMPWVFWSHLSLQFRNHCSVYHLSYMAVLIIGRDMLFWLFIHVHSWLDLWIWT